MFVPFFPLDTIKIKTRLLSLVLALKVKRLRMLSSLMLTRAVQMSSSLISPIGKFVMYC